MTRAESGMALFIAFILTLGVACATALRYGGLPERIGAGVLGAMTATSFGGHMLVAARFATVDGVSVCDDFLGFAGFYYLAIYSRRSWPLWAAALQLLSLGSHLIRTIDMKAHMATYSYMRAGPTYMVLILMLIGTAGHSRRHRAGVIDRPWQPWR